MKVKKNVIINGKEYAMKKSKYAVNYSPVHVSDSMSGKMSGIPSISTSCLENPICNARRKDGNSICAHCFAAATLDRYKAAGVAMANNYHLLTETVLDTELLPVFANVAIVRIESFGDVANITHALNYLHIIKANPNVQFAWWSKNMGIIKDAIEIDGGKPANVILVDSSAKLNVEKMPENEYVDKVFTVYDAAHIESENINVNCGARCCATCRRCYSANTEKSVYEKLK